MGKKPAFQTLAFKNRKEEITYECFLTINNLKNSNTYKCDFKKKSIHSILNHFLLRPFANLTFCHDTIYKYDKYMNMHIENAHCLCHKFAKYLQLTLLQHFKKYAFHKFLL